MRMWGRGREGGGGEDMVKGEEWLHPYEILLGGSEPC